MVTLKRIPAYGASRCSFYTSGGRRRTPGFSTLPTGDTPAPHTPRMNKVLVTGGAGFIGSNIARLLLERGHEVVVLDDLSSGYRHNLALFPAVRLVEGDVRDREAVDRAMAGCEVVFHLAASVGNTRSIEHPLLDSEINVLGTLTVLEAARRHGLRKVVFSSSAGIFGELKTLPITRRPCGRARLARTAPASSALRSSASPTRSCIRSSASACATSTSTASTSATTPTAT